MAYIDNVRDLELLILLAKYGSFTDAALEAGVSQPSVSQAIKRLEKKTGIHLVHRRRFGAEGGARLTAAGLAVAEQASRALTEINTLPRTISESLTTRVRNIGLPPIISSLLSIGGGVAWTDDSSELSFQAVGSQKLLGEIEEHKVDYGAVASIDESLSVSGVEMTKLASYPFGMACTEGMVERLGTQGMTTLRPEDLIKLPQDIPFVTLNRDFVHSRATERLMRLSEPVSHLIEVSDVETLKMITTSGLACSLITSAGIRKSDGLRFIPFTGGNMPRFNVFLFNDTSRPAYEVDQQEVRDFSSFASERLTKAS